MLLLAARPWENRGLSCPRKCVATFRTAPPPLLCLFLYLPHAIPVGQVLPRQHPQARRPAAGSPRVLQVPIGDLGPPEPAPAPCSSQEPLPSDRH